MDANFAENYTFFSGCGEKYCCPKSINSVCILNVMLIVFIGSSSRESSRQLKRWAVSLYPILPSNIEWRKFHNLR